MTIPTRKPYHAHQLGSTAHEVLQAFYAIPASQRPLGRDIYEGIEFFYSAVEKTLCKRLSTLGYEVMSKAEEQRVFKSLCEGAVELYVQPFNRKQLMHAATGKPLPAE